jgi:hypothetical protein
MSMDLRLIPVSNSGQYFGLGHIYVTDQLSLSRDYKLFAHIDNEHMGEKGVKQVCKPKPLPPGFEVMMLDEEEGWKKESSDPYGSKLTYVTAEELLKIKPEVWWSPWDKGVRAMIGALPKEFPFILWWH